MQTTSTRTPSIGARCRMFILTWEIAREPATSQLHPPSECRMWTPCSKPLRLASMKAEAGPWNQVAVIHPSGCHTVANRSQSPASRQMTQFSTTSRMAARAARSASVIRVPLSFHLRLSPARSGARAGAPAASGRSGRANDSVPHHPDAFDFRFHHVAVLHVFRRRTAKAHALRRAGGDDVAGFERQALREELQDGVHGEDHI